MSVPIVSPNSETGNYTIAREGASLCIRLHDRQKHPKATGGISIARIVRGRTDDSQSQGRFLIVFYSLADTDDVAAILRTVGFPDADVSFATADLLGTLDDIDLYHNGYSDGFTDAEIADLFPTVAVPA